MDEALVGLDQPVYVALDFTGLALTGYLGLSTGTPVLILNPLGRRAYI